MAGIVAAKDLFGRIVRVGDLVVYGHSGRYAGTRVGLVYRIDDFRNISVFILEKERRFDTGKGKYVYTGKWVKGHHSKPNGFVKIDPVPNGIPQLKDL